MALTILTGSAQAGAINYSYRTSGSADWASVPTSSYFYDQIDQQVRYRNSAGDIQNLYTFPYTGSAVISGSLIVSGSILGAISTASYALTSSYVQIAQTASYVQLAQTASYVTTAQTASYVLNAQTASYVTTAQTASYVLNAVSSSYGATSSYSLALGATIGQNAAGTIQLKNSAAGVISSINVSTITASLAYTASYVQNAITASYILNAVSASYSSTASYVQNAITASYILQAVSSSYATTSSYITSSGVYGPYGANSVLSASYAASSSYALTASYFTGYVSPFPYTGSAQITGSLGVTGSVNISGSTTQIGNNTLAGNTILSGSIVISGSILTSTPTVKIYGDTQHNGYIKFDPVSTNISPSISASYIYVSGSTQDLYFTQNGSGYGNTTRLRWLEGNLYTGLLSGGIISSTPGSTTFTITSGSGIIVLLNASTSSVDPYPTVKYVVWNTQTLPITNSGSAKITYVGISDTGTVVQQTVPWGSTSVEQWDQQIELGVVLHLSGSVSTGVYNSPQVAYGFSQRTDDFVRSFGPLKISGHTLQASGSTLSIIKTAGTSYNNGSNYTINPNHPSTVSDPAITTSKIYRYYVSGSTPIINTGVANAGYSVIDPTLYNNNGVLTSVPTNGANLRYTIQRVFWFPNSPTNAFIVYYGNTLYASLIDASNGIGTEVFTEAPNTAQNAILIGYILVAGDATDLTVASKATIVQGGLFRSVNGIGSSNTSPISTTLASLSDVAVSSLNAGDLLLFGGAQWNNTKTLTGTYTINGGLTVTGSLIATASRATSASYADLALTASYITTAQTASYVLNAVSSSFASTASYITTAQTASYVLNAVTASYVLNAQTASYVLQAISSSYASTASYVTTAQTASYVLNAVSASFASSTLTASYVQTAQTASYILNAISASYTSTASFVQNSQTASYVVTAQTASYVLQAVSASFASTSSILVTSNALISSTAGTINSGVTTIYNVPTASYDGAWFDYTVRSGSNARAGTIMGIWSGSAVNYTETTTTDFGNTSGFVLGMSINGANMILSSSTTTNGWSFNTIVKLV